MIKLIYLIMIFPLFFSAYAAGTEHLLTPRCANITSDKPGDTKTGQLFECISECNALADKDYNKVTKKLKEFSHDLKQNQALIDIAIDLSYLKLTRAYLKMQTGLESPVAITTEEIKKKYATLNVHELIQLKIFYRAIAPHYLSQQDLKKNPDADKTKARLEIKDTNANVDSMAQALLKLTKDDDNMLKLNQHDLTVLHAHDRRNNKSTTKSQFYLRAVILKIGNIYRDRNFPADDLKQLEKKIGAHKKITKEDVKKAKDTQKKLTQDLAKYIQKLHNTKDICQRLINADFMKGLTLYCNEKRVTSVILDHDTFLFDVQKITKKVHYISSAGISIKACYNLTTKKTDITFLRLPANKEWTATWSDGDNKKNKTFTNTSKNIDRKHKKSIDGHLKKINFKSASGNIPLVVVAPDCSKVDPTAETAVTKAKLSITVTKKLNAENTEVVINTIVKIDGKKIQKDVRIRCIRVNDFNELTERTDQIQDIVNPQEELPNHATKYFKPGSSVTLTNEEQQIQCTATKAGLDDATGTITVEVKKDPVEKVGLSLELIVDTNAEDDKKAHITANVTEIDGVVQSIVCKPIGPTKVDTKQFFDTTKEKQYFECTLSAPGYVDVIKSDHIRARESEDEDEDEEDDEEDEVEERKPLSFTPGPPPQYSKIPPNQPYFLSGMP